MDLVGVELCGNPYKIFILSDKNINSCQIGAITMIFYDSRGRYFQLHLYPATLSNSGSELPLSQIDPVQEPQSISTPISTQSISAVQSCSNLKRTKFHIFVLTPGGSQPQPVIYLFEKEIVIETWMTNPCYLSLTVEINDNPVGLINTNKILAYNPVSLFNQSVSSCQPITIGHTAPIIAPQIFERILSLSKTIRSTAATVDPIPPYNSSPDCPSTALVACNVCYLLNDHKIIKRVDKTVEIIFGQGDQFTVFIEIVNGNPADLDPYQLIMFPQPGARAVLVGQANKSHIITIGPSDRGERSISLFHPIEKRHRGLFSFCIRKIGNKRNN